ncbi:MAG TPA: hypothetical protein VN515_05735 [Terriglobales bacterium]|nr:hypothetical protein [Terriglobales bacterium]
MRSSLPPSPAQAAVIIGFVAGTWLLVEGFALLIAHRPLMLWGHPGPWAAWGSAAILLGALWMLCGNLYLFQNRSGAWKAMIVLTVASSWYAGWAVAAVIAQLLLLLLPSTRRGLNA